MKKTLLFTLLISVNLCSQEFWEIDSNSSFIKYSGNHFLHNWDAQNDEISGLLNIENGTIDNVGVIAKVKDFNSGNSSLDSNAMRVVEALKYPNVIFRSSLIEQNDDRVYLEGVLEFHGIKQNLKVEGKIETQKLLNANHPLILIDQLAVEELNSVAWYLDCGDDDYLYKDSSLLHLAMKKKGVKHEYRVRDGAHTWYYWKESLPKVLRFVSINFHNH